MAAGVVLRSADDRTALFTQWLAPHLPMVRGLVRRHTYFAGERADDYQTAVLHLLEHLDDLAHFALCLTARRDTAKPRAATANHPAPADEPPAQPTTPTVHDFDETRALVDESSLHPDKRAPYLYAATAEIDESAASLDETLREVDETLRDADEDLCEIDTATGNFNALTDTDDEMLPADDEHLRAIDAAAVDFEALTDAGDESLREVDETLPTADEDLCEIDTAAGNFDALTDTDDESLPAADEDLREIDAAAVDFEALTDTDDEMLPADDEHLRAIDAAAVDFEALTDAGDESLREVDETLPTADEDLCEIDTAAGNFDALTDTDDESLPAADEDLREIDAAAVDFEALTDTDDETLPADDEPLREVDETAVVFDETAAEDEAIAAAADERQPYADAAPDEAERTPAPLPVTAEEVLRTVGDFNPRPWLAGVTLRLLSTLNHRALRHRETHLTPASVDSDELFDPADPDGDLWAVGADPATAGAQRQAAPSRWEETLGAGRERTGGSAGVTTRDAAPARAAQAASAHAGDERAPSPTAASAAQAASGEEAAATEGEPTAAGEGAGRAVDNCLECWHREQPRRGFHRTRGGRLWNAMRARAQQAHSAFAYRAVLRADAAAALAAQPLRDRALVLLTADGWTAEEIGLAVGASPTAVRQTVCRVRTRLRRWRKAWARRTHATRAL